MCTRSLRCPQHTDSQRKNVRQVILENHSETDSHLLPGTGGDKDKEMIDVDTWDEGDSIASLLTTQVRGFLLFNLNGATTEKCDFDCMFSFAVVVTESRRTNAWRGGLACRIHLNIGKLNFLVGKTSN